MRKFIAGVIEFILWVAFVWIIVSTLSLMIRGKKIEFQKEENHEQEEIKKD